MVITVMLEGEGGALLIEANTNNLGWSRCTLIAEKRLYLGADTLRHLVAHLLDAVGEESEMPLTAGEIAGHSAECVLLLSEAHHALYVAASGSNRLLFWQDASEAALPVVRTITLTPKQRRQWRGQLETLLETSLALPSTETAASAI